MTVSIETEGKGALVINFVGGTSTSNGGLGAVANPEGVSLFITRTTFYFATKSTGAANLSVGVGTTATTAATDILNALAVGGVSDGSWYNGHAKQASAKTAATAPAVWTSSGYITFSGSASTAGLTGKLYVEYYPLT
jgi:hypothetical protein